MANLKITDLRKYLKNKSCEELQQEIVDIVKNFKEVKEYYNVRINPESEEETLLKYKKVINDEFLPDRGFGKMRYSEVRKALKSFQKLSKTPKNIADLMLCYAEVGIEFTNTFGDIDERFYGNIEKAYCNALEYIFNNDLQTDFKDRAEKIQKSTRSIGWGFGANMRDIFSNYYISELLEDDKVSSEDENELKEYVFNRMMLNNDITSKVKKYDKKVIYNAIEADVQFIAIMDKYMKDYSNTDEMDYIFDKTGLEMELIDLLLWYKYCYEMSLDYWEYDAENCIKCSSDKLVYKEVPNVVYADYLLCKNCGCKMINGENGLEEY